MSVDQHTSSVARSIVFAFLVLWCVGPPADLAGAGLRGSLTGAKSLPEGGAAAHSLAGAAGQYTSLPLRFELNLGQTDSQVRFLSNTRSGEVFLTPREMVLRVHQAQSGEARKTEDRLSASRSAVVRLQVLNPNPNARVVGLDPLPGKTNYFLGNDSAKWRTNVPSFGRVKYEDIYPGIDLVYYGHEGRLEYDFQVAPGADPRQIAMSVEGADGVAIDESGDLVLNTAIGEVRQYAPHIYQQDGSGRREIAGGYVMRRDGTLAFTMASYDAAEPLVIDPELVYSTYFGGTAETDLKAIAVDSAGSVYVAGDTYSHDFPTKNPVQASNLHSQSLSAIITKFSPDGQSLVYSTYLGGSDTFAVDVAVGIALDSTGAVYVTGAAGSSDFPTKNPIPGVGGGIFVTKLSADGSSLVYSSVLGGSGLDNPRGIVLDSSNHAYIFGDTQSTDFPTVNPTQATSGGGGYRDGFWSIISADGSQLLFSTYVGGNNDDDVRSLHVMPQSGDVWISGITQSSNFAGNNAGSLGGYQGFYRRAIASANRRMEADEPTISWQNDPWLGFDFFVPPSGPKATVLLWIILTQGGGLGVLESSAATPSNEIEVFVSGGCAIVAPATTCSGNAAVITEDTSTSPLTIKSVVNIADHVPLVNAVVRDSQDAIYVTGFAERIEVFPLVDPIQGGSGGSTDAHVMVFAPSTRQILFSTYLGGSGHEEANGIALDPQGNIYIAGQTTSPNFPTTNAYQATPPAPNGVSIGEGNSFIVKISTGAPQPVAREPVERVHPSGDSTHVLPPRPGD